MKSQRILCISCSQIIAYISTYHWYNRIPRLQADPVSGELSDDRRVQLQPSNRRKNRSNFQVVILKFTYIQSSERLVFTMDISRWSVNLCCWASTAVIAAVASFPNIAMFDFRSWSLDSAASSLKTMSGLPAPSRNFAWRFETSITYLGLKMKSKIWRWIPLLNEALLL